MLSTDTNLSTKEFIKYFVTDPNVIRHFEWCLSTIQKLEDKIYQNDVNEDTIWELESRLDDAYYDIDQLKERNKFLEEEACSLENEITSLEDDIINMRDVIAELNRGKY